MPIHPTERLDNIRAVLGVWFTGLTLTGSPELVLEGAERTRDTSPFVRLSLEWLPGRSSGHSGSARADERSVLVVLDLFWPPLTADTYQIERAASELCYALRGLSLALSDYADDPGSPPAVEQHPLRFLDVPEVRSLSPVDGYDRRRVQSVGRWFSLHS